MENPLNYTVAHKVIDGALGDADGDKNLVAERVRDKLFEQGLVREESLLAVQVTIIEAVAGHRQAMAQKMPGVSLTQRIHTALTAKQLLK